MKSASFIVAFLLALCGVVRAGDPILSVYHIIRESDLPNSIGGELILKVYNPPGRTYYVMGLSMADVPYVIEIQKGGKWVAVPQPKALLSARLRPMLPDSYLLFNVPLQVHAEDSTFRVRAFIYTGPDKTYIFPGSPNNEVVEVVSAPFSSKDFK